VHVVTEPGVAGAAPERLELRFSGSGGQGIILAATLTAAAATQAGRRVVQTQSYGPEARGGASKAEVIIDREAIDFPEVDAPDITVCLSQPAWEKYAGLTRRGGLLLYDSGLVTPCGESEEHDLVGIPFTEIADRELGKTVAANIVALGALLAISGFAPPAAVEDAIEARLPAKIVELNLLALDLGRTQGAAAAVSAGEIARVVQIGGRPEGSLMATGITSKDPAASPL
jgi:2-oxoglutarate ferredoxin oxidoreductase subunit gamma